MFSRLSILIFFLISEYFTTTDVTFCGFLNVIHLVMNDSLICYHYGTELKLTTLKGIFFLLLSIFKVNHLVGTVAIITMQL